MTHTELRESLAVYRDLRGPERAEVDQHLAGCAECSALLNSYRAMDRSLSSLRDARPDNRLRQGFYAAIDSTRAAISDNPARRPRLLALGAPLAGSVLVVILLGVWAISQGWLPGVQSTGSRPFGRGVPTPHSSLIGSFIPQTDGEYGYQILRPLGWERVEAGRVTGFALPGSAQSVDRLVLTITNLRAAAAQASGQSSTPSVALSLFEKNPTLEGWTAAIEQNMVESGSQPKVVRNLPTARMYLLLNPPVVKAPGDASPLLALTTYKVDNGQPLVITLQAKGAYASLDRLEQDGLVDDLVTMVESARAIPVDLTKVASQLPGATATPASPTPTLASTTEPASTGTPEPVKVPSAAATEQPEQNIRDWETTQVTLDIFSGRPNPAWPLSTEQDQELRALLAALPEVACKSLDMQLGYRGFVVHLAQRPELSNEYRLRIYAGRVRWGDPWSSDPSATTCRSDSDRQVERFLLASGRGQLSEDIYGLVETELAKPLPAP